VLSVVHLEEGLAVAGAAAVVDGVDDVAVVDQILQQAAVAEPRLASRPAMHPDECRRFGVGGRLVRPINKSGDLDAVVRLESRHLDLDQVDRIDLRGEALGQATAVTRAEVQNEQVVRRATAVGIEGELGAGVVVDPHHQILAFIR
jgi:hypothetical protein